MNQRRLQFSKKVVDALFVNTISRRWQDTCLSPANDLCLIVAGFANSPLFEFSARKGKGFLLTEPKDPHTTKIAGHTAIYHGVVRLHWVAHDYQPFSTKVLRSIRTAIVWRDLGEILSRILVCVSPPQVVRQLQRYLPAIKALIALLWPRHVIVNIRDLVGYP